MFINDLEKDMEYTHVKLLVTPVLGKSQHSGRVTTEGNLDRLAEWANGNLTKYSMDKCKVPEKEEHTCSDRLATNQHWRSRQTVFWGPLSSLPT